LRLAQFGALPLLTVVASQFPAVNHFWFSWVRPALEALKRCHVARHVKNLTKPWRHIFFAVEPML
jgi:hypothetical protein